MLSVMDLNCLRRMLIRLSFVTLGVSTCICLFVVFGAVLNNDWSNVRNACAVFGPCFCAYGALTCYAERRIRDIVSGKVLFDDKQDLCADHSVGQATTSALADIPTELSLASTRASSSVKEIPEDSRYAYQVLLGTEIRLIKIHPSKDSDTDIELDLIHIPLHLALQQGYIALSYTWGDSDESEWIKLNGTFFTNVRRNVFDTLKKLRSLGCTNVWIDAICTNQSDQVECNTQVLRMKSIYGGARKVVVALAPMSTENTEQLVQILSGMESSWTLDSQAHKVSNAAKGNLLYSTLANFCTNPYWSRIWIVQEFAIGLELEILIQDQIFAAEKVETLLRLVETYQPSIYSWQALAIFHIRQAWHAKNPIHLMRILELTSYSKCKVRHDRVFGLLGLAPESLRYLSEPDYGMNLEDIAKSIARFYIQRNSADFIFLAQGASFESSLPSWCPDLLHFDHKVPNDRIMKMLAIRTDILSNPSDRSKWNSTAESPPDLFFCGNSLLTSAARLGTVQSLGSAWSDPVDSKFPAHHEFDKRHLCLSELLGELHACFLGDRSDVDSAYSYLKVFSPGYDWGSSENGEMPQMTRWIYRNRRFMAGDLPLEEHAERLQHPIFHQGLRAWHLRHVGSWIDRATPTNYWRGFESMAKTDTRLMCVAGKESLQFGWAPNGARLNDEVFLIPGCGSPALLRPSEKGAYQLIGDATVVGAMGGKAWKKLTPENLQQIEII